MNNPSANIIATGSVNTHAKAIFFNVLLFKFPAPPDASIDPAIPLESTWVVLTGKPKLVLKPMVAAATISEVAPWA